MSRIVLLDAGPLGLLIHPRQNAPIRVWLSTLLQSPVTVLIPEIADYEVRREVLRIGSAESVARLDGFKNTLGYAPITTEAMLQAAAFWADIRRGGRPTADATALDGDVILAAQARAMAMRGNEVVVATTNVRHIERFVPARIWSDVS